MKRLSTGTRHPHLPSLLASVQIPIRRHTGSPCKKRKHTQLRYKYVTMVETGYKYRVVMLYSRVATIMYFYNTDLTIGKQNSWIVIHSTMCRNSEFKSSTGCCKGKINGWLTGWIRKPTSTTWTVTVRYIHLVRNDYRLPTSDTTNRYSDRRTFFIEVA